MGKWVKCKLEDCIEVKHGYAFKGPEITATPNNNVLVTPGNFHIGGGFKSSKYKYFNGDVAPNGYIFNPGDIAVTMTDLSKDGDTLGYSAKIPYDKNLNFLHNQRIGKVLLKSNKYCLDYLYWLMRTSNYQSFIVGSATGTSIKHTSPSRIQDYEFLIPKDKEEQEAIASILSRLDDKIDLLNRENETVNEMSNILFNNLIINNSSRDQWQVKPLDKIANYLNGLACQKYPPKDEFNKLPVLKIKDLRSGISKTSDYATTDIESKYIINRGDIIFSWSASLMVKLWDGEKCILNQHLFKVTSEEYPRWFIYHWTKYHLNKFISIAEDKATTMGHIRRSDLSSSMAHIPDDDYIKLLDKQFSKLEDKYLSNKKQIQTLESLRDTLLPKLMSGEVRVEYAKSEVNNVYSINDIREKAVQSYFEDGKIEVRKICSNFGIPVVTDKQLNSKAEITYEDENFTIFVNSKADNFSIAHELGHYFKHSKKLKEVGIAARKGEESYSKKEEQEADDFAAELLMPEECVLDYIEKVLLINNKELNKVNFKKIKNQFNLSDVIIEIRLRTLGFKIV